MTMTTTAENMSNHPEWFANPETLAPEVLQFLAWQGAQPNPVGEGSMADAWAQGGTGPYYVAHVATARATIGRYNATGEDKPWLSYSGPVSDNRAKPEGATFGGA